MRARRRVSGALGTVAVIWVACAHDDDRARCPEPVMLRPPMASSAVTPHSGDPGRPESPFSTCLTPFALVRLAPGQNDCPLPPAESARWTPVPATRTFVARRAPEAAAVDRTGTSPAPRAVAGIAGLADAAPPTPPASPAPPPNLRRQSASDPGFCVFEWSDRQKLPDRTAFERIQAVADCPMATDLGAPIPDAPRAGPGANARDRASFTEGAGVARSFEVPSHVWSPLTQTFDRQARGFGAGAARWPQLYEKHIARPRVPVRVAVLDSTSKGVAAPDRSKHGFAVSRVIGSLFCDDSGSVECERRVLPHIALPMLDVQRRDYVAGGFFGNFHQWFDALSDALDGWDPAKEHLVVYLGSGWVPVTAGPRDWRMSRLVAALERASCQGALLIAGSGSLADVEGPPLPAALESSPAPDAARCQALGFPRPRPGGTGAAVGGARHQADASSPVAAPAVPSARYTPLVHAVGTVDARDQRTALRRRWSQPRLVAYGLGVSVAGSVTLKYTPPTSGSSMAAAIVAGIAASVWSARPDLEADQVMALVYEGGVELDGGPRGKRARAELCLGEPFGPCTTWAVRRAVLCGALARALPEERISCAAATVAAEAARPDARPVILPVLPEELAPALSGDVPVIAPCALPRCGIAFGPDVARIPAGTSSVLGAAACSTCTLNKHFAGSPYALLWGYPALIPPNLRYTVLTVYSSIGDPQSYLLPSPAVANALFARVMLIPDDAFYAVIDWVSVSDLGAGRSGLSAVLDTTETIVN